MNGGSQLCPTTDRQGDLTECLPLPPSLSLHGHVLLDNGPLGGDDNMSPTGCRFDDALVAHTTGGERVNFAYTRCGVLTIDMTSCHPLLQRLPYPEAAAATQLVVT